MTSLEAYSNYMARLSAYIIDNKKQAATTTVENKEITIAVVEIGETSTETVEIKEKMDIKAIERSIEIERKMDTDAIEEKKKMLDKKEKWKENVWEWEGEEL